MPSFDAEQTCNFAALQSAFDIGSAGGECKHLVEPGNIDDNSGRAYGTVAAYIRVFGDQSLRYVDLLQGVSTILNQFL